MWLGGFLSTGAKKITYCKYGKWILACCAKNAPRKRESLLQKKCMMGRNWMKKNLFH